MQARPPFEALLDEEPAPPSAHSNVQCRRRPTPHEFGIHVHKPEKVAPVHVTWLDPPMPMASRAVVECHDRSRGIMICTEEIIRVQICKTIIVLHVHAAPLDVPSKRHAVHWRRLQPADKLSIRAQLVPPPGVLHNTRRKTVLVRIHFFLVSSSGPEGGRRAGERTPVTDALPPPREK